MKTSSNVNFEKNGSLWDSRKHFVQTSIFVCLSKYITSVSLPEWPSSLFSAIWFQSLVPALILLQIFSKCFFFKLSALLKQSIDGKVLRRRARRKRCAFVGRSASRLYGLHPHQYLLTVFCFLTTMDTFWIRREWSSIFEARVRISSAVALSDGRIRPPCLVETLNKSVLSTFSKSYLMLMESWVVLNLSAKPQFTGNRPVTWKHFFNLFSSNTVETKNTTNELELNRLSVRYCYSADLIPYISYTALKPLVNILITRLKEMGCVCRALDDLAVAFLPQL